MRVVSTSEGTQFANTKFVPKRQICRTGTNYSPNPTLAARSEIRKYEIPTIPGTGWTQAEIGEAVGLTQRGVGKALEPIPDSVKVLKTQLAKTHQIEEVAEAMPLLPDLVKVAKTQLAKTHQIGSDTMSPPDARANRAHVHHNSNTQIRTDAVMTIAAALTTIVAIPTTRFELLARADKRSHT